MTIAMTLSDGRISVCVGWTGLWELVKMEVALTLVRLPRASFVLLGTCPFLTESIKLSASDQGQVSLCAAGSPETVREVLLRLKWIFLRKSGGLGAGDPQLTKMDQKPSSLAPQ